MNLSQILFVCGIVFFSACTWMHVILAFSQGRSRRFRIAAALVSAVVLALPVFLPRVLYRHLAFSQQAAFRLFVVELSWDILLLWFGCACICCDLTNLCVAFWKKHRHLPSYPWIISWRQSALISLLLSLLAAAIGYLQTGHPAIRHTVILDSRIPQSASGYRIMLCSDMHLGTARSHAILDSIEKAKRLWNPHLFLHAGDLINGLGAGDLSDVTSRMASWHFPDGKYACLGNHDGYNDITLSTSWHEKAGLVLLGNIAGRPSASPAAWLHLGACDDPIFFFRHYSRKSKSPEGIKALAKTETIEPPRQGAFNILLRHQPIPHPEHFSGWQMMLSGHTHGGQIFPFSLSIPLSCPYRTSRWYRFSTGMRLYVCQGTGFWGPALRFLVPPEIVIIELRHTDVPTAASTHHD